MRRGTRRARARLRGGTAINVTTGYVSAYAQLIDEGTYPAIDATGHDEHPKEKSRFGGSAGFAGFEQDFQQVLRGVAHEVVPAVECVGGPCGVPA